MRTKAKLSINNEGWSTQWPTEPDTLWYDVAMFIPMSGINNGFNVPHVFPFFL
jgi:hypothetical protein